MLPVLKFRFRINKLCHTGKSSPWGNGPFGIYYQGNYKQQNISKSAPRQNKSKSVCRGEAKGPREIEKYEAF